MVSVILLLSVRTHSVFVGARSSCRFSGGSCGARGSLSSRVFSRCGEHRYFILLGLSTFLWAISAAVPACLRPFTCSSSTSDARVLSHQSSFPCLPCRPPTGRTRTGLQRCHGRWVCNGKGRVRVALLVGRSSVSYACSTQSPTFSPTGSGLVARTVLLRLGVGT